MAPVFQNSSPYFPAVIYFNVIVVRRQFGLPVFPNGVPPENETRKQGTVLEGEN